MNAALVLTSGGQDSTTCLYWAKSRWQTVHAIAFDYGQRHRLELNAARRIAELAGCPFTLIDLRGFGHVSVSALTKHTMPIEQRQGELPSTFTPGRNIVFLGVAAAAAASFGIRDLVTGVCETDYSGYPDCRRNTIESMEQTLRLGLGCDELRIHTPLMHLSKSETVKLAESLPGCWDAMGLTHTCYADVPGGCGTCPACKLRAAGFEKAGLADPAKGSM